MRNKLKFILLASISALSFLSLAVGTIAWFGNSFTFADINDKIKGDSAAAYFAYGNGTEAKPYGIRTARQLYNLAWLQYNGTFNKDANGDHVIDKQYYFEIDPEITEINMSGWVLPPIGTEDYPFVGSFNGNGKTIKSLTISNKSNMSKPNAINYNTQPEIVGMFGVVGKIDSLPYSYNEDINVVENVTLNTITVESKTSETLIGLAAGYMNGEMSGVKISGTATIDVNGQQSSAKTDIEGVTKLSDYSLVGYTTKTANSSNTYSQELSEYFNIGGSGGSGEEEDWGGSFNSKELDVWFRYLSVNHGFDGGAAGTTSNTGNTKTVSGDGGYKLYYTTSSTSDPTTNQVVNRMRDSSYIPLRYTDENKVKAHIANTGYICGANIGTGVNGSPKISSYKLQNIGNSLGNTTYGKDNYYDTYYSSTPATFTDSKLEILTYSFTNSSWYRIKDTHNATNTTTNEIMKKYTKNDTTTPESLGLQKYNDSRNKLTNILSGGTQVHGIKFDTQLSTSSVLTVPANTIRINGSTINTSYQLPKGGVDFNIKKTGFINFFAGSYNSGGYSSDKLKTIQFFSLYKINRTGGNINNSNGIVEITKIYRNKYWDSKKVSDSVTNPKYFYQYSGGSFSNIYVNGATRAATANDRDTSVGNDGLEFDVSSILGSEVPSRNCIYYFEIPVNDGEFAIGAVNGSSLQGAYLMYLDIGANGDKVESDEVTAHHITTIRGGNSYPLGVDFIPISVTGTGGSTIGVSIDSKKQGTIAFVISTKSIAVTNTNSIGVYSYKNTDNCVSSSPGDGQFTCSLTGDPPSTPTGGERVLLATLKPAGEEATYHIRIIDQLSDNAGTISSSTYELDSGSGYETSSLSAINALLAASETNVNPSRSDTNSLRNITLAATLTRGSGSSNEFTTSYDIENCSYGDKTIAIVLNKNGASVSITVETGYKVIIGEDIYNAGTSPVA